MSPVVVRKHPDCSDPATLHRAEGGCEGGITTSKPVLTTKGSTMYDALRDFTASLPELLQWVGILLAAAIPFVESYFGSVIGIVAGVNPVVAIIAAIIGNMISMLVFVLVAHRLRTTVRSGAAPKPESPRRMKLRERFDRYGVAGVSLLGQTLLPSQITSAAMVSFGASRNAVILWQTISIIIWGVLFGVLAVVGVAVLR
jgi:steroid 5-alpha reductase family enzyme